MGSRPPLATVIMMYTNIISLICTVSILLISCAGRVVVRDTEVNPMKGTLWAPTVHEKIRNEVRAVVLNAAEVRSTPVDGALRQLNIHDEASPSRVRAVDRRTNDPRDTLIGTLWQPTVHEDVSSRQPIIERADSPVGGYLFESAVHDSITDS